MSAARSSADRGGVLMVGNFAPDVGYAWWLMETYWATLADHLRASGRHAILAYPEPGEVPARIAEAPIEVVILRMPRPGQGSAAEFIRFVRQRRVTGLYLTDRPLRDPLYISLRRAGVQRVVVHDHTPGDRPRIGGVRGAVKSLLARTPGLGADRAVAVTEFVRRRMIENGRFPPDRCIVVPNGIPALAATPPPANGFRRRLGVSPDTILIVLASRASSYKNWSFGIQLAHSMANQYDKPVAWVFCGDGPDLEAFKAEAGAFGVAGICHFLGRVGDLPAVLAECDIGFHPSLGEVGYCLAILEFMRSGLPVVVSNRPSVCGATEDGTTGLVYAADDIASAARQMHRLFADPALRLRLGKAAQHEVARRFSLERSLGILRRQVGDYL